MARSSVFETTFSSDMREKQDNVVTIDDSTPAAIETMLDYIYTGKVTADIGDILADVLQLADKYNLPGLPRKICEKILLDDLVVENAINTFILVVMYKCSSAARDQVTRFFKKKVEDVVKTEDWKKAMVNYPDL